MNKKELHSSVMSAISAANLKVTWFKPGYKYALAKGLAKHFISGKGISMEPMYLFLTKEEIKTTSVACGLLRIVGAEGLVVGLNEGRLNLNHLNGKVSKALEQLKNKTKGAVTLSKMLNGQIQEQHKDLLPDVGARTIWGLLKKKTKIKNISTALKIAAWLGHDGIYIPRNYINIKLKNHGKEK